MPGALKMAETRPGGVHRAVIHLCEQPRSKKSIFLFDKSDSFNDLCRPNLFKTMARVCQITGKSPISGNSVSHSNIKTKRRFLPNLQTKRFFLAEEDKWITLKVSTEGLRTINKNGLLSVVKKLRATGEKI
jgi:large subunit ribosomal protein L28